MVGSKPNAYLTEETRLEAQRLMLVERYGLFSDDSDDAEEARRDSAPTSQPVNGASNHIIPSVTIIQPPPSTNGRPAHPPQDPLSTNPDLPPISAPAPTTTSSSTSSTIADRPTATTPSSIDPPSSAHTSPDAWPPLPLTDPAHSHKIHARFDYTLLDPTTLHSPPRDVRVTQITHYSSQLLESHQRKIAVNNEIVSYGVGGHVRAMLRHSTARCLLKGHNSVVADIEFLAFQESRLDNRAAADHISILGSVADDGSVYVWKLVRNGDGDEQTLDVADAIRFEHPDFDKGKSYKRIAFRPGPNSIIAENGIGVAMLLLDINAPDLRIVELVKMNDKMMVRDKFLRSRHEVSESEVEGNLDAAAWLSETIVATSRGGHVFLWNADNTYSCCIARVPRERTNTVTAIHTLMQDVLLFVVGHGRELEVWTAKDIATDMSCTSLQLQQTIRLFKESDKDVHCVASVDPSEQLVTISNVRGNSFFVLHFNRTAQAFDAMTEVPMKHSIYSFCLTPLSRPPLAAAMAPLPGGLATPMSLPQPHEEVGVWCVQPPGIQVVHLPAGVCRPGSKITPEIHPKPVTKTVRRKVEKIPTALIAQTQVGATSAAVADTVPVGKRVPRSIGSLKSGGGGLGSSESTGSKSGAVGATGATGANVGAGSGAGANSSAQGKVGVSVSEVRSRGGGIGASGDADGKGGGAAAGGGGSGGGGSGAAGSGGSGGGDNGGGKKSISLSSISTSASSENAGANSDEIVEAILNGAKKAITSFEASAGQRTASEKAKMEKLIESVSETAESNIERFINSSMKKVLAETLIPGVSQIIADARDCLREKSTVDGSVAREHFEEVFERAEINQCFGNACKEMERQVSSVVGSSMASKYECLIQPCVEAVNDASDDVNSSVVLLREELRKLKEVRLGRDGTDGDHGVVEIEAEDVQRAIEEQISQGNVDEAFLTALDKGDLNLVTWLCGKFEANTFFLENNLSQVSLMSLAQQLGQGLGEGDVLLKVDWLKEVMLALEPEAEDIESISQQEVRALVVNVNELRRNSALMEQHAGLERNLKTLARLITSHLQD